MACMECGQVHGSAMCPANPHGLPVAPGTPLNPSLFDSPLHAAVRELTDAVRELTRVLRAVEALRVPIAPVLPTVVTIGDPPGTCFGGPGEYRCRS